MTSPAHASASDVLLSFFHEMHRWEKKFYPIVRSLIESDAPQADVEKAQDEALKALENIYDQFDIVGKRNRSRTASIHLEDPPTYDEAPQVYETDARSSDEIHYLVQESAGLLGKYRYGLKRKGDHWHMSKREYLDARKGWIPVAF